MTAPVCLISGVGPGTGSALARRFAEGGYRLALLAERLVYIMLQEPHLGPRPGEAARAPETPSTPVKKAPHFAHRARL